MTSPSVPAATAPLRSLDGGLLTAFPAGDDGAHYDRHAAIYDRLIGSRLYNRVVWGCDPSQYATFTTEALANGDGPFLDVGGGTAVFTADVYRRSARPVVLVDRSEGMLRVAGDRLDGAPVTRIQADLFSLPFERGSFSTVGCFAMLHVLEDPWRALAALRDQLAAGAKLYASMLVVDRAIGRRYHRVLERRGEMGPPRTAAEFEATARGLFVSVDVSRTGSMAWLRATA